jgi:hypothetical protein
VIGKFHPRPLYPQERNPGIYRVGGWAGPRASLNDMVERKISCLLRQLNPGSSDRRPVCILTSLSRPLLWICFFFLILKSLFLSGLFNNPAIFIPHGTTAHTGPASPHYEVRLHNHTQTHHQQDSSGRMISPSQRPLSDSTQYSDIHNPLRDSNPQSQHPRGCRPTP